MPWAQLADTATGRVVPLSDTEAAVVGCFNGVTTSADVLEALAAAGVPVHRQELTVLLERLERAGFLEAAGLPTPRPLRATDGTLPRLRGDLVYKAAPRAGLTEVRDLRAGRSFTLFEYELTVARMLDGRHSLEQVARASERLGFALTTETLLRFVEQLGGYGFLEDVLAPPVSSPSPAPPARGWSDELRELYELAAAHAREGRFDEAEECLLTLLEVDGSLAEAKTLLDDVRGRRDAMPGVDFGSLHGVPAPAASGPTPVGADGIPVIPPVAVRKKA